MILCAPGRTVAATGPGLQQSAPITTTTAEATGVIPVASVVSPGARNRRLARNFERYARTAAAFVRLATIRIMLRA